MKRTQQRVGEAQPEAWVVNGKVIRYLDPMQPEDGRVAREGHTGLRGLLSDMLQGRARRQEPAPRS